MKGSEISLTREEACAVGDQLYYWVDAAMGSLTDMGINELILKNILKKMRFARSNIELTKDDVKILSDAMDEYITMNKIDIILEVSNKLRVPS
ncbi:unnamed protein product [marine sediment metagenome]|uniref:Uncharacterized protein n=1 Tax=marine sediment metagenome TaxID=412755 RepID=X0U1V3_9ZZZZ